MSEMPDGFDVGVISGGLPGTPTGPPLISAPTPAAPISFADAISNLARNVAGAAQAFYGTQAQIEAAKANAAIARAQGANSVQVARSGAPSTTALLLGGGALVALLLVMENRK